MPLKPRALKAARSQPVLELTSQVWSCADPGSDFFNPRDFAPYAARCHRRGQAEPRYTSSTSAEIAAFETIRYTDPRDLVSPQQRLLRTLEVTDLPYLDFTDALDLGNMDLTLDDLTRDHDFEIPQLLADVARERESLAALMPSAAHPGAETLVLFPEAFAASHVEELEQTLVEIRLEVAPVA